MDADQERAAVEKDATAMNGLVIRSSIALVLGAVLVALCYYFVDRPVAWFVVR